MTSEREPILVLDEESEPLYKEIIRRLDKRAVDHRRSAGHLLWIILFCVVASITLIAFAGTILGTDLQNALMQRKQIQGLEAQKKNVESKLEQRNARTAALKGEFDRTFLSRSVWASAELPDAMTARLTSVELRGTTGFAVGESQFVYTMDGGQSWSLPNVNQQQRDAFESAGTGHSVGSDASLRGWVVGKRGKIARTTDGVKNWQVVTVKEGDGDVYSVFFKDGDVGWAAGGSGLLAKTIDGGATWTQAQTPTIISDLYQVKFFKDGVGVAIGTRLTLLFTNDEGKTWEDQSAKIAALVPERDVADLSLITMYLEDARSYADVRRIMVAGTNGIVIVGEADGKVGNRPPRWRLARLVDGKPLDGGSSQVVAGTLRWIDRFSGTPHMIGVGDKGTILISRDRGDTWRSEAGPADRPRLLFVQATGPDRASIAGADGYLAQLDLVSGDAPVNLTREDVPGKESTFYQLSPRNQREQVAVGEGILRRVTKTVNDALLALRKYELDGFRAAAINPELKDTYSQSLSDEERSKLATITSELREIDSRVTELKKERDSINTNIIEAQKDYPVDATNFMIWLTGARGFVVVIAFFVIRFLVSLYRYHNNQAARFEAQSDSLRSMRFVPATIAQLRSLFEFGTLADEAGVGSFGDFIGSFKELAGVRAK